MRYFIVFYQYTDTSGFGFGTYSMISELFPSRAKIQEYAAEGTDAKCKDIVITGIQELTESDYIQYSSI